MACMARTLWLLVLAVAALGASGPVGLPIFYLPNTGQAPGNVAFIAKGSRLTAYFQKHEILLRAGRVAIRVRFDGANPNVRLDGENQQPGRANFLTGKPRDSRHDIPMFGAVRY